MNSYAWKKSKCTGTDLCWNCMKRRAGGEDGTLKACGLCAQQKRVAEKLRLERLNPGQLPKIRKIRVKPPQPAPITVLPRTIRFKIRPDLDAMKEQDWVEAKRPQGSISWLELSSGRSNA